MIQAKHLILGTWQAASPPIVTARNPATGRELAEGFPIATAEELDKAVTAASGWEAPDFATRAALLRAIAEELGEQLGALRERMPLETALPVARVEGEMARTQGQLRAFAAALEDGSLLPTLVDEADPGRSPAPKPRLERRWLPVGPVAVFGASNFPLAFGVAGGDTAAALAAGCPVIAKAHPLHPGVSELVAEAIRRAFDRVGVSVAGFALLHGGAEVGQLLATHPGVRAVGFTGSHRAGMALFRAAQSREVPIPVFAEMGSVNPVFVLPGALRENRDELAQGFADSLRLGVGQFCTNPGVIVLPRSGESESWLAQVASKLDSGEAGTMLSAGIGGAFVEGVEARRRLPGVTAWTKSAVAGSTSLGQPTLLSVAWTDYQRHPFLREECFGPVSIAVLVDTPENYLAFARAMEGQLTATIHSSEDDLGLAMELTKAALPRVGRLVHNGWPTGVEVSPAMTHGGPYPATTDSRFTSVGLPAVARFARPVTIQTPH